MRNAFFIVLGFIFVFSISFVPVVAHAGIIEFLFPSLKPKEYDPAEKMIAPFALENEGIEEKGKLNGLPVNAIALSKPHLLNEEISAWVMTVVANAMNFDSGAIQQQISDHAVNFDEGGKAQYSAFLQQQKILDVLQDGRFNVRSYADEKPLLLNEGVVKERYRWLYRVPVVVTYLDRNMKSYKGKQANLIQKATLNIQIGRVGTDVKEDGLQIEQWSGKMEAMGSR